MQRLCLTPIYYWTNAALGHVAGVAAAVAVKDDVPLRTLSVTKVQRELEKQGAGVL